MMVHFGGKDHILLGRLPSTPSGIAILMADTAPQKCVLDVSTCGDDNLSQPVKNLKAPITDIYILPMVAADDQPHRAQRVSYVGIAEDLAVLVQLELFTVLLILQSLYLFFFPKLNVGKIRWTVLSFL